MTDIVETKDEGDSSVMQNQEPVEIKPEEPTIVEPTEEGTDTVNGEAGESAVESGAASKKRKKATTGSKKTSAEALQRRREGRLKAAATMAQNLKKTGIGRFEDENGFGLTSVKSVPLINQKNYYTDYLKKDEQVSFIRNWRTEKMLQQKLKNLKKNIQDKKDDSMDMKNFDDFNLNDIESEMIKKKELSVQPPPDDDDEEEDEEENEIEEVSEEKAKQGSDTIVIHPGSSFIRIGRATDAYPQTVPAVIAVKDDDASLPKEIVPKRTVDEDGEVFFDEEFDEAKAVVTKDFKARMRFYKRRILPNSRETAANYNKKQWPETIPDHNDPYSKSWITDVGDKKFFVGEDALKLPISDKFKGWKLRFPIKDGKFNEHSDDYTSSQEILGDLANIVLKTLENIDIKEANNLKAILVISDLYDKMYVETWVDILFRIIGLGKVAIIQESVAATFGAGASSACVIDVGAQTTTVSCVDEGLVINDSRVTLNYGGDDITECFMKLLLQSQFPYKEINLDSKNDDWELAQTLKHNYITFQDADIAVQLYNFYKRKPFETTKKYDFKVFDEVMLAPLGLFFPELFQIQDRPTKRKLFSPSTDQYSLKSNNPYSRAQENLINKEVFSDLNDESLLMTLQEHRANKSANPYAKPKPTKASSFKNNTNVLIPLEKAIIESISVAAMSTDFLKAKKLYDNLLFVGGGFAKIAGFDQVLSDRINIWRPKYLSTSTLDEILDYVTAEKSKVESAKNQEIKAMKEKKRSSPEQVLDDIELTAEELNSLDEKYPLNLDFEYIDSLCDKGSLISVNVLPPPREFDPEMLTWKGGSVYGRLKVVSEMWISQADWDLLQSRSLYYKSLFNY